MKSFNSQTRKSETLMLLQSLPHWSLTIIAFLGFFALVVPSSLQSRSQLRDSSRSQLPSVKETSNPPLPQRSSETPNASAIASAVKVFQTSVGALSLTWTTCGSCPEPPEISVSGDKVSFGVANRSSNQLQNMAVHGAAAVLPPSSNYTITFDYDWFTFDSYSSPTEGFVGFWDSFSVSVAANRTGSCHYLTR